MATSATSNTVLIRNEYGALIHISILSPTAVVPTYCKWNPDRCVRCHRFETDGCAKYQPGFLLYSARTMEVAPDSIGFIQCDISIQLPLGYSALIIDPPGNSELMCRIEHPIMFDSALPYRVTIPVRNFSLRNPLEIAPGNGIAYLIVYRLYDACIANMSPAMIGFNAKK